jgi:MFS family permease
MTAVVILLASIAISFVVVRVGAVAFELTGIPWDQAKFQSLSAFTNSGFTTRESEEITRHPVRRRIASILIVLGNAGLVAVVGGFAGSLLNPRPWQSVLNLGLILAGVGLLLWIGRGRWVGRHLRRAAKAWLDRRYRLSEWSPRDLLHLDEGFALTRFAVPDESPALGRRLSELNLKDHVVQVLAIERGTEFRPVPRGEDRFQAGDRLVVFGPAEAIGHLFEPEEAETLEVVETEESLEAAEAAGRA